MQKTAFDFKLLFSILFFAFLLITFYQNYATINTAKGS